MIQDFAFSCSSYEEYCSMYDALYGKNEKKEEKPIMRLVKVRFVDGLVKTFNMAVLTIADMLKLHNEGAVVLGYEERV